MKREITNNIYVIKCDFFGSFCFCCNEKIINNEVVIRINDAEFNHTLFDKYKFIHIRCVKTFGEIVEKYLKKNKDEIISELI